MKLHEINFEIIEHTKRILLYLDQAYFDIYDALHIKNYPFDTIINTHAGLTAEAIEYLLAMTKITTVYDNYFLDNNIKIPDFDPDYVYTIFFQCMNKSEYTIEEKISASLLKNNRHNKITIANEFVLINIDGEWCMFYSYNGVKKITYKKIDINILQEFIYASRKKFAIDEWNRLFAVSEISSNAESIYCVINKYTYDNNINTRFREIVYLAKNRLTNDAIGITLPYIYLLDNNLDVVAANKYLDKMANICSKN